jgi:D-beta-D-heptose 7-phosphate kinase/D-beta-D-heptose 1-phosphate adenosyltransferase
VAMFLADYNSYFSELRNKRVFIIGDILVDKYVTGVASRMSPDAPVPILDVQQNELYLGASGMVVKYILAFGGIVDLCTVFGKDFEGDFIFRELQNLNIGLQGICRVDTTTPQVTRIKARGKHLLRLEKKYDIPAKIRGKINEQILTTLKNQIKNIDVILFLDYNSGLFQQNYVLINNVIKFAQEAGTKVIVRPEKANYHLFTGVDIAKFNVNLATEIVGVNSVNETSIRITANKLMNEMQCKGLYLSLVDDTSYCLEGDQFESIPPFINRHGESYVGTGSAQIAALSLLTAANAPLLFSAQIATFAGALSALKPPVTFFSLTELQDAFKRGFNDYEIQ